ncbi:MAG: hypothetical protein FJ088_01695, partial [Deltaproteobacteria bacterium]|nr:hypothetical protein [Deltaproteobacteria bacterium]
MRTIIFIIVFACSFLNIDSVSAATSSNGWAFTIDSSAGSVYQKYVYITSSDFYRFRTYNLSQGMDTVLHVYNLNTNQWIGSNDDVANGNCGLNPPYPDSYGSCKVIYINSSTSIMVFVHRYSNSNTGSAVFELKSGAGSGSTIVSETIFPRGDITRTYSGGNKITWAANDTFQYAFKMGGLLYPLVLVAKNTEEPFKWSQSTTPFGSGGIWGQPNILLDSASDSNKNPAYIVGTNSSAQCYFYPSRCGDGTAKYYKNDYLLIDSDSDKIGNGLESALGTNITQADTDGDGIR